MTKRTIFWVLVIVAILGAVVAVTARSSRAEAAVDDCLSKPNALPPQGSHWYYRIDRASNRRCWYLGPQGEKVSQTAAPKQRPSPKAAPKAEPSVEAVTGANEPMPAAPVPRVGLATSVVAIERMPALASDNNADEPSQTRPEDDMPLIWPVLTAADLAAAEAPTVKSEPMLALAAAAAALALAAIIVRKIFKLFAVRRLRRRRHDLRVRWEGGEGASGARKPAAPAFAATAAAAHPVDGIRKSPAAPRPVDFARKPTTRRHPSHDFDDHAVEDPEIEQSLRRLLHDWRRAAA